MDVESMKKMNNMVVELKKHGFAENATEAFEIVSKDAGFMKSEEKEENSEAENMSHEETIKHVKPHIDKAVDDNNKVLNNAFNKIWDELKTVKAELQQENADLKKQVAELKRAPVASAEPQKKLETAPKEKSSEEGHPRSGGYDSDDVSVESVFYCGNK